MFDGEAFGAQVVEAVKVYVDEATAPLIARIAELEKRPTDGEVEARIERAVRTAIEALPRSPEVASEVATAFAARAEAFLASLPDVVTASVSAAVDALPAPQDGRDADPEVIRSMVAEAVAALPRPRDGRDADPAVIRSVVADAIAELPPPRDGADADPQVIRSMVAEAVAAIPRPQDGRDADPKDVQRMVEEAVARLPPPKDGVGVAGAVIDREGRLILTLTNGEMRDLGRVEGKNGDPGFSLTDFEVEQLDLRTLVLSFIAGEVRHSYEVSLGGFIDRGVFKDGQRYELGDAVTWGGSLWIAQCETKAKPETNGDWRLAVKRGRDGKDLSK